MRIINEALSDLKAYARRAYGIKHNIPILIMLISEEEHQLLCETLKELEKKYEDRMVDVSEVKITHYSKEFFPSEACMFPLVQRHLATTMPMVTTIIKNAWTTPIPRFSRYKYVIMIRGERLLEYAQRCFPNLKSASGEMTDKDRKAFALMWLSTHEFLHIIEGELNKKIYMNNARTDGRIILDVMKQIRYHDFQRFLEEWTRNSD